MRYVILVSHGGLAEGLKSSLSMFAGDQMDQVLVFGLKDGESIDQFEERVTSSLKGLTMEDTVLVLGDIIGGSPLTTVSSVLSDIGKLDSSVILGGLNLTMGLTGLVMKDLLEGKELAQSILSEASSALQEFEPLTDASEEEDI
ncbi:PTS sugar transporter subunit IIA [Streptococcus sp. 10F2]